MGRQSVFRTEASSNQKYTIINNKLLQDARISRETKGLICELMSRPLDWEVTVRGLIASGSEGKHKIYKMINEAKEYGYMADGTTAQNGKDAKQTYIVSDDPDFLIERYNKIANDILKIRKQKEIDTQKTAENISLPENQEAKKVTDSLLPDFQEARNPLLSDFQLPNFQLPKNQPQQIKEDNKEKNKQTLSQADACDDAKPKQKLKRITYSERFEKFWGVYAGCCKRRECPPGTKQEAYEEWKKLDDEDHSSAEKLLKSYVRDCEKSNQTMKHGCRYLRHKVWETYENKNEKPWYEDENLRNKDVNFYKNIIHQFPPNGVWNQSLGPPPGHPKCIFTFEAIKVLGLEIYKENKVLK